MAMIHMSVLLLACSSFTVSAGDIGTFWQLTDIHYDSNYSTQQSQDFMCHYWPPDGDTVKHGEFGDYACDAPWTLVVSAINAMKLLQPEPDFLLWTGDSIPHVPNSDLNPPKVFGLIQNVTSKLMEVFEDIPIFPVLGNHDVWPANQYPGRPDAYYDSIIYSCGWESLLKNDAKDTFQKGGFYSMKTPHGQRIIGLNTNLYYNMDKESTNLTDPALQFMWLEQELSNAQRAGEKVYIMGHVPPGTMGRGAHMRWFTDDFNQHFLEVLQTHSDCIVAAIFGHEHTDSFRIVYDSQGAATIPMFLAPAVTPWKSTLYGVGANNPSIRLYHYDRASGQIVDYDQYFLNLTAANVAERADWLLEYKASEAYSIKTVSAENLKSVVQNFSVKSSDKFKSYYKFNSVSWDVTSYCDSNCKLVHLCSITNISYTAFEKCIKSSERTGWGINHFPADMVHHYNIVDGEIPHSSTNRGDATPAFVYFVIAGVVVLLSVMMLTISVLCFRKRNVTTYFGQQQYMPISA